MSDYATPQAQAERPQVHALVSPAPMTVLKPQCAITIAVDTAYVVSVGGGSSLTTGIYMMDNEIQRGSTGEGALELSTQCNVGDLVGFNTVPINAYSGDTVSITGFQVEPGTQDVFTSQGYPIKESTSGDYWIGQAMQAGNMTYQIKIAVSHGLIRPTVVYVTWDPYLTAS